MPRKKARKREENPKISGAKIVQYTSTSPCLREVAIFFPNLYRPVFCFRVALRSFLKVPLKRRVVGGRQGVGGGGVGKMSTS